MADISAADAEMVPEAVAPEAVRRSPFSAAFSRPIVCGLIVFGDVLAMWTSGLGSLLFVNDFSLVHHNYVSIIAAYCVCFVILLTLGRGYTLSVLIQLQAEIAKIIGVFILTSFAMAALVWGLDIGSHFDPVWALMAPSLALVWVCTGRVVARRIIFLLTRRGILYRSIAIVGTGKRAEFLLKALQASPPPWIKVLGIYDDRLERAPLEQEGVKICGTIDDLIRYARDNRVDEVMVTLPWGAEDRLPKVLNKLRVLPANIGLAPEVINYNFPNRQFRPVAGLTMFNVYPKPIFGWGWVLKNVEDFLLSLIFLILLSPIMLMVALAIKLESKGPVLFKQKRYGYNNNLIEVYKFRSMYQDRTDVNAEKLATKDDPRVTKVGRIIRKTSLDELPQLVNVLRGQMSIVGPRPHATKAKASGKLYQEVVDEYSVRHRVKPGITGWAQVNGWRGETDTEEKIVRRVECDIYYMENWSLMLDIEIIIRTVLIVFLRENAY